VNCFSFFGADRYYASSNTLILKLLLSHQSKTLTSTISICSLLTHRHKNSISRHIIHKIGMSHMSEVGQLLAYASVNVTFKISQYDTM